MHYTYRTSGTCASEISFDIEGDIVSNVSFQNGCDGNLKAIGRLIEGWKAEDIIDRLQGLTCEQSPTSCADQLARAVAEAVKTQE